MTVFRYPNYRSYWSSNPLIRLPLVAESMPLKRFEKLKRYLHIIDNDSIPSNNKDIFIKIRPLIEKLNETFSSVACPLVENVAVDEMIIPFKGRSRAKQYIKSKPKKWGFKAWVLATADGFVSKFEMYQGASMMPSTVLGPVADTVVRLCEGLQGKNHKLFLDNLFTSVPLVQYLKKKDIYVVGTVRANRLGGANKKLLDVKKLSKQGRGSVSIATSTDILA